MKKEINKQKNEEKKVKKKKSKFFSFLQYAIIIFMVVFNVVFITKAVRNPNKTPDFLGIKTFVIVSGSMEPNIQIGDMVIIKVTNEPYKVGDVIAFREGNIVVVHRIIQVMEVDGKTKYQTKGDNNNAPDKSLVDRAHIEGLYQFKVPKVGNVFMFIYNNFIIIIIILLIIMIFKFFR